MSVIYRNGTYYGQESSGSGSGGHTILDSDGTSLEQRTNLKFSGMNVTDDSENDTTLVEVPEMTEEDIQDIKDAFTPNTGAPLRMMNYSTDEQVVGTWIDGKPLYQRTVSLTAMTSATTDYSWVSLGLSDIDNIFIVNGYMAHSAGWNTATPFWQATNDYLVMTAFSTLLRINSSFWSYYVSGIVTVQYTKTTD